MKEKADVVIIGGGVASCSCAYYLAKKGVKNIVLVEKEYITAGGTGRCAACFLTQWDTTLKAQMVEYSIEKFKSLGEKTGYGDLEMSQHGYLTTTYTEEQQTEFRKRMQMYREVGIEMEELTPQECKEKAPYLNTEGILSGFYTKQDGHINPFKLTFAFQKGAQDLGVEFAIHTEVIDLQTEDGKVSAVVTNRGTIQTKLVINATEPKTKYIGRMVGMYHPVEPKKHQIVLTEPMEYMGAPFISSYDRDYYIHQTLHGNFMLGMNVDPYTPMGMIDEEEDREFLEAVAVKATKEVPALTDLRVIRHWAGHYGMTPDMNIILGPVEEIEGYLLCVGASKSMMMSPAIGVLISEMVTGVPEEESELPFVHREEIGIGRFEDYSVNPGGSAVILND